ncbi:MULTISPECIES: hypothetical protein [unclassified Imperialibacter]|uniref:hypothetical protein n=1 Tax=unclassified Imperialibacter TaxID=2629706 RepID=UPI001253F5FC|nr:MULTISPECIES: hypothetical protein [unclassified Imperialibacter]CAD5248118.1 exported hypothetical protein [Imperialibacter sp. 75]CAD5248231.1 exported hypothetical protein [Imperialibacter sp. 89]VVS97491.1 exported hypothetical protein [Imperialibacter sp. EC-SDR9]
MISKVYSPAFYLILWVLLLVNVPQSHAQQASVSPQEGDTLDNVTISEAEARNIMKGLFDLPRLTHSLALGRIAKDERLTAFTDGFMQRNNIQVLTIGYIESDEFWPRIFRQQRLNKINKADNDNLLAAKIIFVPVATDGPPTGYTTTLELTGKTSQVYELLSISQAEVDSIAASTSQQQLGSATFATPNEAKETVVSALIAALADVEISRTKKPLVPIDMLDSIVMAVITGMVADSQAEIDENRITLEERSNELRTEIESSGMDYFIMEGVDGEYVTEGMSNLFIVSESVDNPNVFEELFIELFKNDRAIQIMLKRIDALTSLLNPKIFSEVLTDLRPTLEVNTLSNNDTLSNTIRIALEKIIKDTEID